MRSINMHVIFEAPQRRRILKRSFMGIVVNNDAGEDLWWCFKRRKWVDWNSHMPLGSSNTAYCASYKAFLQHVKKHTEVPKGYTFTLISCYVGYNIYIEV
jgi:hypothetical protein